MNSDLHISAQVDHEIWMTAQKSKAWPFQEAERLVSRYRQSGFPDEVLFETGYGPSGLPHIGTFGEIVRTSMVRHAFEVLTEKKVTTRLLCFSDDMDGLRKIPDNVPNREMMAEHMGKPLSKVPDPFGSSYPSFAHHNNARLCAFLDRFGFDYEFASASDYYTSGIFDDGLICILERYEAIMKIMLPTLGEERQRTYAPILPLHPETGIVMQVPIEEVKANQGCIVWSDPKTGKRYETSVTKGHCKAQWKPDWALRWAMLKVDYEMSGKDHIDNVKISGKLCRVLGRSPPEGFHYELFLDQDGGKISKSKGNGLSMDEWLSYASQESLSLFMYQKPKVAKRLYFDIIPRHVDEYYQHLAAFNDQDGIQRLQNPVWHIHCGKPIFSKIPVSFSMLLNLVSASNASDKKVLWGFITNYNQDITPLNYPELDRLVGYAIRYFEDFVKPVKSFRFPNKIEYKALISLDEALRQLPEDSRGETIQSEIFTVGKEHGFENLREWFQALYQILLGQDQGPRFGSFIALYGINKTRQLIVDALAGKLVKNANFTPEGIIEK